jgi:anti-sigma factor RsiW
MDFTDEHGQPLSERDLRELAAYADGSLDQSRSAAIARRIEQSPALAELVDGQLQALEVVRASAVPAPASLRVAIDAGRAPAPRRRRVVRAGGLAAAAAALAAVLVISLPSGSVAPSVAQAVALANRGVEQPPPAQDAANSQLLAPAVDGVHYPYWEDFGWRTRGARDDRISGRAAVTVYYTDPGGHWVAYTIVGGAPLSVPAGAGHQTLAGTRFAVFSAGSRTVVTWLRHGHSCVLSGVGVPAATMLELAAWHGRGGALAAWGATSPGSA